MLDIIDFHLPNQGLTDAVSVADAVHAAPAVDHDELEQLQDLWEAQALLAGIQRRVSAGAKRQRAALKPWQAPARR